MDITYWLPLWPESGFKFLSAIQGLSQSWPSLILEQIKQTSVLEWIAVIFGVIQVLLAKSNKILLYPAGIIATITTAWVLFHSRLYAESALNVYYLVMSIYGWYFWSSHNG